MNSNQAVLALSGGVGGAKLAHGLAQVLPAQCLTVVCNSGDDFEWFGLKICPDLDSINYALARLDDRARGWGRRHETWNFLHSLRTLSDAAWFQVGDRDLAMHVWRTDLLRRGYTLTEVALETAARLGLGVRTIPISDDSVRTLVHTDQGVLAFQEYFVRESCKPSVLGFEYAGADAASTPIAAELQSSGQELRAIVLCPSNPWLSIDPILEAPGWRSLLENAAAPVVAVSPIVGGRAIKGPAAKIMTELKLEVSPLGIALHYGSLIDALLIDHEDAGLAPRIEALGIRCGVVQSVMRSDAERRALATAVLNFADKLAAE